MTTDSTYLNTRHQIDRRTFSSGVIAGMTTSLIGVSTQAQAAVSAKNIVFVHGLFADGSC
jgi:hypothetical protein